MTEHDQARAALMALGVPRAEDMSQDELNRYVSALIGALMTISGALATQLAIPAKGLPLLLHAMARVIADDADEPVSAVLAELARGV